MYKVFVNDTPIIITSSLKKENNYLAYRFNEIVFDEILHQLKNNTINGIILYSTDLEQDWRIFTQNLKVVPAAGGLVLNAKKEVLFIYRNNTWDLPKGKIEKGETIETAAIREVEEECGISNISIDKKLLTTYHIYNQDGLNLKETHWFLMYSDYQKELIPQLEEGITQVVFKNKTEIEAAFQNTYANIKLVYDTYQET
ncbi:NUDIX domain-containing protein [Polaribacter litorisediminis]|uniref:NUDIX hydrolase n=1 Tax=Polaribacter litorisediminis TaxID=1908341 RepID=UPI001CC1353E|nr:NUDIX domain-containing protein [Polaribacter litorisediminis]UAM98581.1 NUDIX domain-containing protein [Polaribacter litorisediminis]